MSRESALAFASGGSIPPAPSTPVVKTTTPPTSGSPGLEPVPQEAPDLNSLDEIELAEEGSKQELKSTPFNQLAKKEAELVRQRTELKKEQESIAEAKKQAQEIQRQYQEYLDLKQKNPIEALKKLGFSEADLFNFMAENEKKELSPEEKAAEAATKAADARIKAYEDEQANKLKKEQEEHDQALIQSFKSDLTKTLEANKEKYEYCAHYGSVAEDLAYEYVVAVARESEGREVPTAEEAIQAIEEYYEEQDKAMMTIKKRHPKTETKPVDEPKADTVPQRTRTVTTPAGAEPPKPTISRSRTLSSGATATVASARPKGPESPAQKRARLEEWLRTGQKPS